METADWQVTSRFDEITCAGSPSSWSSVYPTVDADGDDDQLKKSKFKTFFCSECTRKKYQGPLENHFYGEE